MTEKDFEQKIDLIGRFRDDFSQFLVRKSNQIVDVYNAEKKSYGEIIGQKEGINIFILTKAFSEFCNEHGFEQKILTKELIKHKIAYSEKLKREDHKKHWFGDGRLFMIVFSEDFTELFRNVPCSFVKCFLPNWD